MSNNLVSEPMPSMQMAQLIDSSGRQMEMGILGPVTGDLVSQPSSDHVGLSRAMPGKSRSQGLPVSSMQSGHNGRSVQTGTLPNSMGSQQLSTTPKRKAPMELLSSGSMTSCKRVAQMGNRPWLQQAPNAPNKGSQQMQSTSNASRTQHSAASSKRRTQTVDNTSGKSGTPRSLNSKSQNTQVKQSSKVQTESTESVRSKMRESLTAALALVSQQSKPQLPNSNTPNDAVNNQGKLENISQCTESASASIDTSLEQKQDVSPSINPSFAEAESVDHVAGEHRQSMFNDDFSEKCKDYEVGSTNVSNNENVPSSMQSLNCDKQDFQSGYTLTTDDVPFSDGFFMKDELLQGNGLSWVLSDVMDVGNQGESQTNLEQRSEESEGTAGGCREEVPLPALIASRIEAELFKLFGGVNKKYKEKGRSLLFNLKDRNNPELRERVMFGEIPPEQLCSMTAEELASKELSQWRQAKAEEFAQMVVLPDSDVDIRRLVKKTHKGEFQVEVDHEDNVPVEEVSAGTTSVARSQTMKKDVEGISPSEPDVIKDNVNTDTGKSNLDKDNTFSITISSSDGADPMQGLMTDDALKDPDFLPPIVSLDEFMESLHSEPPFENLPVETGKATPISDKDDSGVGSKSKSSDLAPSEQANVTPGKSDTLQSTSVKSDTEEGKKFNAEPGAISSDTRYSSQVDTKVTDGRTKESSTNEVKSASSDAELTVREERYGNNNAYLKSAVHAKGEYLWEGMLQLNITITHSVISIFKSGEKTSAKDWPGFLEIKGRVRLDAFEKFLQDLRLSRSRAIMVSHFASQESSPDEQSTLREVADSYVSDERVGFAEPANGVELYFCPPHKKTVEMLSKTLPKEQIEAVNSIDNGLIGIIVWRKTNLTSTISPTTSSHHKHSSKRQYFSRRQQDINVNDNSTPKAVPSTGFKTFETGPPRDDGNGDDDDIPPGFGPPSARVEDDLPEFHFSGGSNPSRLVQKPMGPGMVPAPHSVNRAPSRPTEQMRELVHKYGQNKQNVSSVNWQDKFGGTIQPWNDDDDDIPEWQPQASQNHFPHQQTTHNFPLRPHMLNQSFAGSPQQPIMPNQYLQPPMNVTHGQRNFGPQWVPSTQGLQPTGGPPYGAPAQGTNWPQHVHRSRGY